MSRPPNQEDGRGPKLRGYTSVPMMSPLPHAVSMALIGVLTPGGVGYLRAQRAPGQHQW